MPVGAAAGAGHAEAVATRSAATRRVPPQVIEPTGGQAPVLMVGLRRRGAGRGISAVMTPDAPCRYYRRPGEEISQVLLHPATASIGPSHRLPGRGGSSFPCCHSFSMGRPFSETKGWRQAPLRPSSAFHSVLWRKRPARIARRGRVRRPRPSSPPAGCARHRVRRVAATCAQTADRVGLETPLGGVTPRCCAVNDSERELPGTQPPPTTGTMSSGPCRRQRLSPLKTISWQVSQEIRLWIDALWRSAAHTAGQDPDTGGMQSL